jgi:hypothetical protein
VLLPDLLEKARESRAEPAIRIEGSALHAHPGALSVP